jgi:hypothetical protein
MKKYTAFLLCLMLSALVGIAGADMIVDGDQRKDPFPWEDHEIEDGRADPVFAYLPLARDMKARKGLGWAEPNAPTRVEDFTTYTEVDGGADITVAASSLTLDNLERDETAYVYKDFGSGYWSGDFDIRCKVNLSSVVQASWINVLTLTDDNSGNIKDIKDASGSSLGIILYGTDDSTFTARILEINAGANSNAEGTVELSESTDYYIRHKRIGTTVTLEIATDSNFSAIVETVTKTVTVKSFQYAYAISSWDTSNSTPRPISTATS